MSGSKPKARSSKSDVHGKRENPTWHTAASQSQEKMDETIFYEKIKILIIYF